MGYRGYLDWKGVMVGEKWHLFQDSMHFCLFQEVHAYHTGGHYAHVSYRHFLTLLFLVK